MGPIRQPEIPTLESISQHATRNAAKAKKALMHHHGAGGSVREADYNGHHIVIRTTYEITVDGTPVSGHMGVTNDGQVHYHPIPNMSFDSAVDLIKKLIDVFPDQFHGQPGEHDMIDGSMHMHGGSMSNAVKPKVASNTKKAAPNPKSKRK